MLAVVLAALSVPAFGQSAADDSLGTARLCTERLRLELRFRVGLESEAVLSEEPECDLWLRQSGLDLTLSDSMGTLASVPYSQSALLLKGLSGEAHIQRQRRWAERGAPTSGASRLYLARTRVGISREVVISYEAQASTNVVFLAIDPFGVVSILRAPNEAGSGRVPNAGSLRVLAMPPEGAVDLCLLLFEKASDGLIENLELKPGSSELVRLVSSLRDARPVGGVLKRIEIVSRASSR